MKNWLKVLLITAGIGGVGGAAYYFLKSSPGNELLAYVPNNTSALIKFNLPLIGKEFESYKEELKKLAVISDREIKNNEPLVGAILGALSDPENSGIDLSTPAFLFTESRPRGMVTGLVFKLESEGDFGEYMKKNAPAGKEGGTENGVDYAEFSTGVYVSWKGSVAVVTSQSAETKDYFQNILNRRNPGAKGNLLLSKIVDQPGAISAVLRIDELMTSHEIKRRFRQKIDFGASPFPPGTAIIANLEMRNGHMEATAMLTSLNEDKLKETEVLKPNGFLPAYANKLYAGNEPLYRVSLSVDLPKLMKMLENVSPELKNAGPESKALINELQGILTGDVVYGVSLDTALMNKRLRAIQGMSYDFSLEDPQKTILFVKTKKDATGFLNSNVPHLKPDESGIYNTFLSYSVWYFYFTQNEMVVSSDYKVLKALKSNTFQQQVSNALMPKDAHVGAAFYADMNVTGLFSQISPMLLRAGDSSLSKFISLFSRNQVAYCADGKLQLHIDLNDKKTYPLVAFLRLMDESYRAEKQRKKEREERLKKLEESSYQIQESLHDREN